MPKEKSLFFIGIWIIVLSNFIGLSTEIKNYIFIATGVLVAVLSYTIGNSDKEEKENFFQTGKRRVEEKILEFKKETESKPKVKKVSTILKKSSVFVTKKEEVKEKPEEVVETPKILDVKENPFSNNSESSYEPPIKVRRARIKPKRVAKVVEETPTETFNDTDFEDDDVIVISSDGDVSRG